MIGFLVSGISMDYHQLLMAEKKWMNDKEWMILKKLWDEMKQDEIIKMKMKCNERFLIGSLLRATGKNTES